jgi:hypothetical protein
MAIARDTTAANIKPLEGAIIRRYTAGAAIAAGELVSMMADGNVDPTDTSAFTGAQIVGVALAAAAAAADPVDVVTYGPVVCLTGATVAAIVYGGDTAGEPVETAGTKSAIAGFNESATVLFVRPRLVDLS